jgi:two-component system, OmpR family, phosphate regulon response regulator PhoB
MIYVRRKKRRHSVVGRKDIRYTKTLAMTSKPIILVVDDDLPILVLMRNLLREFGFEAVTAENGREALIEARKRKPAVVLIDKNMPGMSGDEVIRALRAEPGFDGLPILILSGEQISKSDLQAIGADGAVLKPFDILALITQLRSFAPAEQTA